MKYLAFLSILIIASCQDSAETTENSDPQIEEVTETIENNENSEVLDGFTEKMEDLRAESDSIIDSHKKAYTPFEGVERKPDSGPLNFQVFKWEECFQYSFPQRPNFEEFIKDDHDSHAVRTLVDGVIYELAVEDYEKLGADKIDAGFTKFIHTKYMENLGGESVDDYDLQTSEGVYGYASCYTYQLGERTYLGDLVTFGFQDKMVRFAVTAKREYENAQRVKEFVDSFVIL